MEQQLLIQKYFPTTWEQIKLPTKIKSILTKMQENPGYRLLLHSSPGTGKTSTARILVGDTSKYQTMYLSGSNDFNIEVLRTKVMQFCTGFSVDQKHKVCIIDECENIRDNIQDAFKILLDQATNVSFIFITNEIEKVNTAVRSRCTTLEYDFTGDDLTEQKRNFVQFIVDVCKAEGIEYDKEGAKLLYERNFPDFRHVLVLLQQIKDAGVAITKQTIQEFSDNGKQNKELYELIETDSIDAKSFYERSSVFKGKERECLISLGEPYFEYLNDNGNYELTLKAGIIVSKYSDQFVSSINKFVTLLACLSELRFLFRDQKK